MPDKIYPRKHGLCGVYYRVNRNDKWESVCISDMTKAEIAEVTKVMDKDTLVRLVTVLAGSLHDIAEIGHIYETPCSSTGEGNA